MTRAEMLECSRCGREYSLDELAQRCSCGGALLVRYDLRRLDLRAVRARPATMWRYSELLPLQRAATSLGESATPLLDTPALSDALGTRILIKDDAPLPGGTFKARGAAVGVSRAVELGVRAVVMPSAGNAGGVWALYAARAGVRLTVTMARSAPPANQAEVRFAGARLELVEGTLADAGRRAAEIAAATGAFLAATFSEPYRVEGKKTAFLELFDQLGSDDTMAFPRTIVVPVGGGVAAIAALKAAREVAASGWCRDTPPVVVGVQPDRCGPIARAFARGDDHVAPWEGDPDTIAAGLRVPAPAEGDLVVREIKASGGTVVAVSEEEILGAVQRLATSEGVFACPEGAATLAAATRLASAGRLEGPVVLYNTGSGAKYAEALARAGAGLQS